MGEPAGFGRSPPSAAAAALPIYLSVSLSCDASICPSRPVPSHPSIGTFDPSPHVGCRPCRAVRLDHHPIGTDPISQRQHRYYLSPEIMRRTKYSSKSDMWSLGVILCGPVPHCVGSPSRARTVARIRTYARTYTCPHCCTHTHTRTETCSHPHMPTRARTRTCARSAHTQA